MKIDYDQASDRGKVVGSRPMDHATLRLPTEGGQAQGE